MSGKPQVLADCFDMPVSDLPGGLGGAGRRRDPDAPDPSLALVLDEQYHWVPRAALLAGAALMRKLMPGLPMGQLLELVGELNKVWRDREKQRFEGVAAAHKEELRRLAATFQQRAPYEAAVAGQTVNDLKRRMRAQAAQATAMAAAAKNEQRRTEDDSKAMLHMGLSSIQDLSRQVARLVGRNKKLAAKAGKPAPQGQTISCLDRLLLPASEQSTHYTSHILAMPPPQQQQLDPAPPSPYNGGGGAQGPAAAAGARGPADVRPAAQQQQQQTWPGGQWSGSYSAGPYDSAAAAIAAHSPPPQHHLAHWQDGGGGVEAVKAAGLTQGSSGGPSTQPYGTGGGGTLLRVSVAPPAPPAAPMSVWRQRDVAVAASAAAATAAAATATPTRHASGATMPQHPMATEYGGGGGATAYGGGGGGTLLQLHHDLEGLTITPGGGGGGTTLELSAASLADWRGGPGGGSDQSLFGGGGGGGRSGSPAKVHLQMGGGGPTRALVTGGLQGGGGSPAGVQQQQQPRGTPVRVSLRFPRHDQAGGP
ncbi:hypothetical protein TSOC_011309 [Tetrabaena socialis]|uniref:Uncharacterized protein n=1 Tax=Tetrabaena socialis TaxID=47790 RepID=A0A2J7ZQZ7_9CHLO|nr:hypothetical protein TSOC_011309 [Tetrabaena socialis]|eukprot:PNH02695.1 hypothetical protein TSOC_011309 [Tetrabaena socialis]